MKALSFSIALIFLVSAVAVTAQPKDEKFAEEAALSSMAEIELSTLANQKASSNDVKQYAQRMIQDHQQVNDQLKSLASQKNISLPTEMDEKHKRMHEQLSEKSGTEFDQDYIKAMIKDHEKAIKVFENEAEKGEDPDLKQFATETLPVLKEHLTRAEELEQTLESAQQ